METNPSSLILALDALYVAAGKSQLSLTGFDALSEELATVTAAFRVSPPEAILLAVVVGESNLERTTVKQLAAYVGLSNLRFLPYIEVLNRLRQRHILVCDAHHIETGTKFELNEGLLPYLIQNETIPEELLRLRTPEYSFFEFLSQVNQLSEEKDSGDVREPFFKNRLRLLLQNYASFPLVAYIQDQLPLLDAFVFIDTIIDAVNKADNQYQTSLESTVDDATFRQRDKFEYLQSFLAGTTALNRLQLVEKNQETFANRVRIRLTEKALKMLRELEGITLGVTEESSKLLEYPDRIPRIPLVYNPEEERSLQPLDRALAERSFVRLQRRLQERQLPTGITGLLYGAPGTGKTATVYQLARKHRRAVYKVDMTETKSMWYGESQKLVKNIFTTYEQLRKSEKRCPILLFNEADALLSTRQPVGPYQSSNTENAIQNILLEELERFTGILFATSNLVGNLDPAFERRFLYKVPFLPPGPERSARVWKLKWPSLSLERCRQLAEQFDFSPGEIENIVRKTMTEELISGHPVGFEGILRYCREERWQAQGMGGRRIGY